MGDVLEHLWAGPVLISDILELQSVILKFQIISNGCQEGITKFKVKLNFYLMKDTKGKQKVNSNNSNISLIEGESAIGNYL